MIMEARFNWYPKRVKARVSAFFFPRRPGREISFVAE
jgi:hypothetical protein